MTGYKETIAALKRHGLDDAAGIFERNFRIDTDGYGNESVVFSGGDTSEIDRLVADKKWRQETIDGKAGFTPSEAQIKDHTTAIEGINKRLETLGTNAQKGLGGLSTAMTTAQSKLAENINKAQQAVSTGVIEAQGKLNQALNLDNPASVLGSEFKFKRAGADVDLVGALAAEGADKKALINEAIKSIGEDGKAQLKVLEEELETMKKGFSAKQSALAKHQTDLHGKSGVGAVSGASGEGIPAVGSKGRIYGGKAVFDKKTLWEANKSRWEAINEQENWVGMKGARAIVSAGALMYAVPDVGILISGITGGTRKDEQGNDVAITGADMTSAGIKAGVKALVAYGAATLGGASRAVHGKFGLSI